MTVVAVPMFIILPHALSHLIYVYFVSGIPKIRMVLVLLVLTSIGPMQMDDWGMVGRLLRRIV